MKAWSTKLQASFYRIKKSFLTFEIFNFPKKFLIQMYGSQIFRVSFIG